MNLLIQVKTVQLDSSALSMVKRLHAQLITSVQQNQLLQLGAHLENSLMVKQNVMSVRWNQLNHVKLDIIALDLEMKTRLCVQSVKYALLVFLLLNGAQKVT